MTKILLVEDDKSLREIYGVRLLAEGYDIVSAGDGEEALAMAIKDRPALIVSDVMMPKISGFDMLDILRSTTETRDIKVIMMTALSSEDQRKRGESLGADRYLVKSQVGIEDVVRAVHEVLGDAPNAASAPAPAAIAPDTPVARPAPQAAPPMTIPPRDTPPQAIPAAPVPNPIAVSPAPAPMPGTLASMAVPVAAPEPLAPASEPASLPQPTAPFSTPRPAGLGDRIIQPISDPSATNDDVANRMAEELSALTDAPAVLASSAVPVTDTTPPVPAPITPSPVVAAAPAPSSPIANDTGLPPIPEPPKFDFEETPRPPAPGAPVPPPAL